MKYDLAYICIKLPFGKSNEYTEFLPGKEYMLSGHSSTVERIEVEDTTVCLHCKPVDGAPSFKQYWSGLPFLGSDNQPPKVQMHLPTADGKTTLEEAQKKVGGGKKVRQGNEQ